MTEAANDIMHIDETPGMTLHADREQRAAFFTALSKAQGMFEPILKTRTVHVEGKNGKSGYTFNYAPLDEVLEKTRKGLSANGLALLHTLGTDAKGPVLTSMLVHESGAMLTSFLRLSTTTVDYQGNERAKTSQEMASDVTYRRRYMDVCLLGVSAEEDDDGASGEDMARTVSERGPRAGTQSKPPALPKQAPPEKKPEPQKVVPIQKPEPPPEMRPAATSDVAPAKVSEETLNRIFAGLKDLGFSKGKMTADWCFALIGKQPSSDISEQDGQVLLADLDSRKKAS